MKRTAMWALAPLVGVPLLLWACRIGVPAQMPAAHPHMKVAPGAQQLHDQMEHITQAAAKKGEYNCCVNPPCEFCAVHMAKCPCGKSLSAAKAVCRECKGGWEAGEGRLAGIKPSNVKVLSSQQVMAMMQQAPQKMMHRSTPNTPKVPAKPKPKAVSRTL